MIDNYQRLPRLRFWLGLAILIALGAVAVNKAYQKHFNHLPLSAEEQQALGVSLLEFPRNMSAIAGHTQGQWASFFVTPTPCDTLCVRTLEQLSHIQEQADAANISLALGIHIIDKQSKGYTERWSLIRSSGYANHFDRVLLVNPEGQFAGSIIAPYDLEHWQVLAQQLRH